MGASMKLLGTGGGKFETPTRLVVEKGSLSKPTLLYVTSSTLLLLRCIAALITTSVRRG
jgi:hypothetical protein